MNAHSYCRCTYKICTCIYYAIHALPQDPFHQARREAAGITRVLTMLPSRLACPRRWCTRPRLSRAYTCPNAFRMRTLLPFSCPSRAPRPQGLPGTRPGAAWGPAARRPECSPRCYSVPCQTHPAFCQPHRHSERHASGTDALRHRLATHAPTRARTSPHVDVDVPVLQQLVAFRWGLYDVGHAAAGTGAINPTVTSALGQHRGASRRVF